MEKIQNFISEYSWLLKLGIWLGIILWATQIGSFAHDEYLKMKSKPSVTIVDRMELNREMNSFSREIHEKARANSDMYGPKDYFNDLYRLQMKRDEIEKKYSEPPLNFQAFDLQEILNKNVDEKKYTNHQISIEAKAHRQKLENRIPEEFHSQIKAMSKEEKVSFYTARFHALVDWFSTLYARGTLLVWGLFFLRMHERKGVLATILGDKKMFAQAFVFWPALIVKYPSNVIREIVVEAELRRIGDFFRKLTAEEKELIHRVAQSRDFFGWIRRFRKENFLLFQRSFVIALLAVVVVNVFYSVECRGDTAVPFSSEVSICLDVGFDNLSDDASQSESAECYLCFTEVFDLKNLPCLLWVVTFLETIYHIQEYVKKIEHVPLG